MADLRERLQTALGGAYRIERELGGGGMSRVFLAQETALKRRVVIKVLPPEMAAGVNVERFRREIELAASLQHPYIVPLLSAGSSGDLLYYVMPYVEGESLRAKLVREGELSVGETVRILRDVVDALAYAHAEGVVHRDVKPENVLIARKHAVVSDFGVAKAVTASTRGASLTSLGVALGTPAYMAPEQAAADPHVDHRADVYAAGVVGYEMLCGRPPLVAATPQATLAAQVTQLPEPVTSHRPSVPAGLSSVIMRCLEKHPADRWENADELLHQLEAMATPTGGMTPTGATPVISSGTEAAIQRAHPVRVAVLFGMASLGVLGLVYGLMLKLGLPDWVFPGAVALLVVGLPIMLLTGVFERRRALARTTGTTVPTPQGLHRWFTWRRSLLGGAAAFAGLGVATALYMAMRLLGIGPVGTLVASGVLEARQPILLADFVNRTSDSTLGPTLTEAFRVDFTQSPTLKLVDAQSVAAALQRMQQPARVGLTPDLARQVALREGIKAVVTGEIAPVDKGYALSASVVSAADGQVLTAARAAAPDGAHLIDALDKLSKSLRERIGESLRTIRAGEPLAQVTTASLDALRKYSQANRAFEAGDQEGALSLLEEATTLDTGFAMAYRRLAVILGNLGGSTERIAAAMTQAFAHRDRLPELERTLTTAHYYWTVDFDPAKVVAAYHSALELDPKNDIALNNLALQLAREHQWSAAESLVVRGINLGYAGVYYGNAVEFQILQGHYGDAQATLERWVRASPQDPGVLGYRFFLASARYDHAGAEQATRDLQVRFKASPLWREWTSSNFAALALVRGKLGQAARSYRDAMTGAEARNLPGNYLRLVAALARIDVDYRVEPAAGLRVLTAALARHPLAAIPAADRPYEWLARFYTKAGRVDESRRLMAEYERVVPAGLRRANPLRHMAEGDIALAEGRLQDAHTSYRAWHDEVSCGACGSFERAVVYERSGQPDSALVYYEHYVVTPEPYRIFEDAFSLARTYKRLGELYEARGDRAEALDYYGRFVDLWKDADPELQPVVKDVRGRIAQLAAEH
jgi:eukaryotic-like serine/threonine-protein kinase